MARLDNKAWRDFVAWCEGRGLKAVPAHPWTLAAYARWLEPRHRPRTIVKLIRDIGRIHAAKSRRRPDRHPTVNRTLHLIEARSRKKETDAGLFDDADLFGDPAEPPPAGNGGAQRKRPKTAKRGRRPLNATPRLVSKRKLKV